MLCVIPTDYKPTGTQIFLQLCNEYSPDFKIDNMKLAVTLAWTENATTKKKYYKARAALKNHSRNVNKSVCNSFIEACAR